MRAAAGILGVVLVVVAVVAIRDATLSTHEPVDPDSRIEVVLRLRSKGGEARQSDAEAAAALLTFCRLEVNSDLEGPVDDLGDGRFRAVLRPDMDTTDRRQFRGCLEDWTLDHVLIDVEHLRAHG